MRNIHSFLLMVIILQSCTVPSAIIVERDITLESGYRVDNAFIPYVTEFKNRCRVTPKLNIRFGILKDNTVGLCIYDLFNANIIINESSWERYGLDQREALMFHELAHCVMYKNHNDKETGGRPVSIMNPYLLNKYDYGDNREAYISELCN